MQQDDLRCAEFVLADRQRADHIVGDHTAGVSQDMRVALSETQQRMDVQASVHTGQDGDTGGRSGRARPHLRATDLTCGREGPGTLHHRIRGGARMIDGTHVGGGGA